MVDESAREASAPVVLLFAFGAFFAGASDGVAVADDGIDHAGSNCGLVFFVGNQAGFVRVAHESAFEEDCGMANAGEHAETGAFDSTIEGVFSEAAED